METLEPVVDLSIDDRVEDIAIGFDHRREPRLPSAQMTRISVRSSRWHAGLASASIWLAWLRRRWPGKTWESMWPPSRSRSGVEAWPMMTASR